MVIVALGSNLLSHAGPPVQTVIAALNSFQSNAITPQRVSSLYHAPAWPNASDPSYINAVALVTTRLTPIQLLSVLHDIERSFGRKRSIPNAPRTLDLDIVDQNGKIQPGPPELPHPRLSSRAFVLLPLAEVAPDWMHPVSGESVKSLIATLPQSDRDAVYPVQPPPLF
ncbi:MAG: 2-amino-4-hydroxy-6-hydroxymethyldihydropteridine diphosphokinase [Alphaproteobacteria bacterium]|nr:2-amino-4-hydroxy-6-hydroxymethyldihydropteridine diphosphokinase [Alphaproteobacteria bacterium]